MNCLVTGASGLIGPHLCHALLEHGHRVIAISRRNQPVRLAAFRGVSDFKMLPGNILDRQFTDRVFTGDRIDVVYHLAVERHLPGANPEDEASMQETVAFKTNFLGTLNLLERAARAGIGGWIQSSTMNVYDFENLTTVPVDEHCPEQPREINGLSMLLAEKAVKYYGKNGDFPSLILRYPGVYGLGKSRGIVAKIVKNALAPTLKPMALVNDRSSDFVYAGDVANANLMALSQIARLNGVVLNVGSGVETWLPDLANLVMQITGMSFKILERTSGKPRRFFMDIDRARKELGFRPNKLAEGLSAYIRELREETVQQNGDSIE